MTGHAQATAADVSRGFVALLWVPLFVALLSLAIILLSTGVLISPQPDPTEKTIEKSPFFVRRGGHSCCGDLVGRTTF